MYPNNPQNYPGSNMYPSLSPGSARTIICYSANFADPYTGNVPYSPVPGALAVNAQSAFIRKVYLMLSLQLAVVAAMVLLAMYSWSFKLFVLNIVTLVGASVGLLVLSLAISCCFEAIRPYQIPVYIIFTALEGILVSAVTSRYPAGIVTLAALMTAVLVIVLTIYACTFDLTQLQQTLTSQAVVPTLQLGWWLCYCSGFSQCSSALHSPICCTQH
jgi:hypothetical protein